MPALYGITSNANVSVSNTTGLYIGSGNVTILNSAGTLLNLLSNAGTVGFYSTNSGTQVAASVDPSGVTSGTYGSDTTIPVITVGADGRVTSVTVATNAGGTYGNANVTALLSGTVTVGNLITTAGVYWANGAPYSSGGGTIYGNANVAAYLTTATITTTGNISAANVLTNNYLFNNGVSIFSAIAASTYGNANVAAYLSSNSAITIKTTANLNASNISTLNAVYGGSISTTQLYGSQIGTPTTPTLILLQGSGAPLGVQVNQVTTTVNTRVIGANLSVEYSSGGGYLTVTNAAIVTGNVISGNINTNAISATNVSASNLYSNGYYFANGTSIFSVVTSTYGNANVAAYLPTYSGNLTAANISITAGANNSLSASQIYTASIGASSDHSAGSGALIGVNAFGNPLGVQSTQVTTTVNTRVYGANLSVEYSSGGGYLTVSNTATVGNLITTGGVFWSNGSPYATSGGSYGNTQVAAYLPTYSGSLNPYNIVSSGTITALTYTSAGNYLYLGTNGANQEIDMNAKVVTNYGLTAAGTYATGQFSGNSFVNQIDMTSRGNIYAVPGAYFKGDGSKLYNLPIQTGTYSNSNVQAYLAANTDPTIQSLNANTSQQQFQIDTINANVTAANAAIQTLSANLGAFETYANVTYSTIANAGSLQTQINSTNANVTAANATIQTLSANLGSFETYANVTFVTTANATTYSNSNVASYLSSGLVTTISTTGNITANTGSYFIGDGSQLTNLPTQSGTYSNTNVAAYLSGSITTGNITNTGTIVTTGNITAPNLLGTAQYFTGDLHGNVLYDSTKYRFFANAYPLSTPDNTKYANGFLTWIVPTPVYTAGVVQAPAAGSGLTSQGGQTLGAIMSANVYIAPAGGAGNRSTNGHMAYTQVMPTGNMAGVDRSRGLFSQLDVNLNGTTWGTMGSASQASLLLCASAGTTQLLGSGSAAHAVGFNSVVAVAPTNGNISVQYASGTFNFLSFASNSTANGSSIQYARLVSGSVSGLSANLSIVNMIGLHTPSAWATNGSISPTNRYAVLNEDAGTTIQTNGNINVVSTATTGLNSTGVFTATALNAVTGVAGQFASVSNGTGKSGGAMAYWDTTNARWSWFDTNLAVS